MFRRDGEHTNCHEGYTIAKLGKDQAQKEEAADTGTELEEMALQKDQAQKSIDII